MNNRIKAIIKFVLFSLFGIFMFFIPIQIGDINTIPIDHVVKAIQKVPYISQIYGILIVFIGMILPFKRKTWNRNILNIIFAILNIFGFAFVMMSIFNIGPKIITQDSMGPYVLEKVVIPVVMIVPIGSVFLAFLVSYGLMEGVGTLMEPIMRPIFKTPGRSAIDAVTSFVGSYSLALLVTNRVYKENKYTTKEAAIIATGFSTVSATFMIITLSTLGIMEHWNLFFWTSLVITFIATAITARLFPLSKMSEDYYDKSKLIEDTNQEKLSFKQLLVKSWEVAIDNSMNADSVFDNIKSNLKDGVQLAVNIGPTIMSIGVISLIIAQYTGVFDILGYIFYPVTYLLGSPDPMILAKGSAITIADMYVPAIISASSDIQTKFSMAVVCISEVLFFSASIPCILATDIPIKIKELLIIWFERVVISLIIVVPFAKLVF